MENIWQTVKDIAAILGDIGSALVGISTVILIFIHRSKPTRYGAENRVPDSLPIRDSGPTRLTPCAQ